MDLFNIFFKKKAKKIDEGKKLVFCLDCKNLIYFPSIEVEICKSPKNIKKIEFDYRSQCSIFDKEPETINKNNDCKWFEEKCQR